MTTPEAVGFARRLLSADLATAQVRAGLADDAVLVLSELASNALLHGHPHSCGHVELAWCFDDDFLRISVGDGGHPPRDDLEARPPSLTNLTGRGLAIVEYVCERWRATVDGGVRVTAELAY